MPKLTLERTRKNVELTKERTRKWWSGSKNEWWIVEFSADFDHKIFDILFVAVEGVSELKL
jgi:hypothetical protein